MNLHLGWHRRCLSHAGWAAGRICRLSVLVSRAVGITAITGLTVLQSKVSKGNTVNLACCYGPRGLAWWQTGQVLSIRVLVTPDIGHVRHRRRQWRWAGAGLVDGIAEVGPTVLRSRPCEGLSNARIPTLIVRYLVVVGFCTELIATSAPTAGLQAHIGKLRACTPAASNIVPPSLRSTFDVPLAIIDEASDVGDLCLGRCGRARCCRFGCGGGGGGGGSCSCGCGCPCGCRCGC